MRVAAADSALGFLASPKAHTNLPEKLQIEFVLVLYDGLNDDDSHIRQVFARAAHVVVKDMNGASPCRGEQVPLVAANSLTKYLLKYHSGSQAMVSGALNRLMGHSSRETPQFQPVASLLSHLLVPTTTLFEEEKQNLYKDEVREAIVWYDVLIRAHKGVLVSNTWQPFVAWVSDGLDALITHARKELDGPLGWATKPDVFNLGLRVILGSGVALCWLSRLPDSTVLKSDMQQRQLALYNVGKASHLHGIWMQHLLVVLQQ